MKEGILHIQQAMERQRYIGDRPIATAIYLATKMNKPLLIEGEAGVGKTEAAKVLAALLDTQLIRLQCYEGLDVHTALYEWNYQRQILQIRLGEMQNDDPSKVEAQIFSREYLLERPLLRALTAEQGPPVLLIDEIDRADEEFEAFLLELLSDFQVTVPELGTIRARHIPHVVLTSNRTRDLGDGLRRRCLYLWIEYPSWEKEAKILRTKVPELNEELSRKIASFVQELRKLRLFKSPGIAETLDWARALVTLHRASLDVEIVMETLGCFVKDHQDAKSVDERSVQDILEKVESGGP